MTKSKLSIAQTLVAGCLLASSGVSLAAPTAFTWNYTNNGSPGSWGAGVGQEGYISSALNISNATAWANTGNAGGGTDGSLTARFQAQTLQDSGAGNLRVLTNQNGQTAATNETGGAPNHGMDNNGAHEFILFQFSQAVSLSQLAISYPNTGNTWANQGATNTNANCANGNCVQNGIPTSSPVGSDMTVLAYTGADQANMATYLAGLDSGVTGLGDTSKFKKVHVTANINESATALNFAGGAPTSKFWLVGAYNQLLGGSLSAFNDSVKLKSLGGFIPDPGTTVPEPSTLTLAALGLLGAGMRRRNQNRA